MPANSRWDLIRRLRVNSTLQLLVKISSRSLTSFATVNRCFIACKNEKINFFKSNIYWCRITCYFLSRPYFEIWRLKSHISYFLDSTFYDMWIFSVWWCIWKLEVIPKLLLKLLCNSIKSGRFTFISVIALGLWRDVTQVSEKNKSA